MFLKRGRAAVNVQWFGSEALEPTYKTPDGKVANELDARGNGRRRDCSPRLMFEPA